jgi:CRP/FNR family transcriptional regulator, cyclic AMP receptor protein
MTAGPDGEISLLPNLQAAVARQLGAARRDMAYSRGEVIVRSGERCDPGVVIDGLLSHSIRSEDGRRVTLVYIRPGENFGIESLYAQLPHSILAVTPCRVAHFERSAVDDLAHKNASVAFAIAQELAASVTRLDEAGATLAFTTVTQRVVEHMLATADEGETDEDGATVPLTQQQLADAVGSVREVVARVIRDLKARDLLKPSRRGIEVRSLGALYRFARTAGQR